jgi:hypothetical protein
MHACIPTHTRYMNESRYPDGQRLRGKLTVSLWHSSILSSVSSHMHSFIAADLQSVPSSAFAKTPNLLACVSTDISLYLDAICDLSRSYRSTSNPKQTKVVWCGCAKAARSKQMLDICNCTQGLLGKGFCTH